MSDDQPRIEPRCLSKAEAAHYIGVSLNTFHKLVAEGRVPPPIKISAKRVVWDKKRLDEFIDSLVSF